VTQSQLGVQRSSGELGFIQGEACQAANSRIGFSKSLNPRGTEKTLERGFESRPVSVLQPEFDLWNEFSRIGRLFVGDTLVTFLVVQALRSTGGKGKQIPTVCETDACPLLVVTKQSSSFTSVSLEGSD
jgi:hypothetical protein